MAILSQLSGALAWPILQWTGNYEAEERLSHPWALPVGLILASFGWWESFVGHAGMCIYNFDFEKKLSVIHRICYYLTSNIYSVPMLQITCKYICNHRLNHIGHQIVLTKIINDML